MTAQESTGLDGFKTLLKEARRLALWAVAGAALPFAARLVALSPPWPEGVVVLTSVLELISLVFTYQFVKSKRKRIVNRILLTGTLLMIVLGATYLVADSLYTYETPVTKERFVKGSVCTADAEKVFKDRCPLLSTYDISKANYEAELLWTERSIATVRVSLVALWLATFASLSTVLGSFVVYQMEAQLHTSA